MAEADLRAEFLSRTRPLARARIDPRAGRRATILAPFASPREVRCSVPHYVTGARYLVRADSPINAMYDRWFAAPIPPKNTPLNIPMTYLLKDLWKYPTDWVPG